jgi:uncharacterized protein (UPF0332 family)
VTDSEQKSRLALARALRASADQSTTEQSLRDALSRSYYSVFHAGCVLIGRGFGNHRDFLAGLRNALRDEADGRDLCDNIERIQKLRIQADYQSDAVERFYEGSPDKFRAAAVSGLTVGREAYRSLLNRIQAKRG